MELHSRYVARQRVRIKGICGAVNIPWGTVLESKDNFLLWEGKQLCSTTSENAHQYFCQDDDGRGTERGILLTAIIRCLEKMDAMHQFRWNKVWSDNLCQKYRRQEHEDFWLWNHNFYNAPVEDLQYIAKLIDAGNR